MSQPYPSEPARPYQASPPASAVPAQERSFATIAHVVPLVACLISAGFLGFIVSLVIYGMYKDRGAFVRQSAANALNVQLTEFIGAVTSAVLMLVLIGFVTLPLVILLACVLHVVCAINANRGQWYNPPLTIRFVR